MTGAMCRGLSGKRCCPLIFFTHSLRHLIGLGRAGRPAAQKGVDVTGRRRNADEQATELCIRKPMPSKRKSRDAKPASSHAALTGHGSAHLQRRLATQDDKERNVGKSIGIAVFFSAMLVAGGVAAQDRLVNFAADKVINRYEAATCKQLRAQRNKPKSTMEKLAIDFLRNHPEARVAFINKIAGPVLNRLFDCGLIP
jgi:hypothetical protein